MIKSSRWQDNEIIYTSDLNLNSTNLIENLDFSFEILGATMIINGLVATEALSPDMTIQLSSGIAKDSVSGNLLISEEFTSVAISTASVLDRRDIIEIRRIIEEGTAETRQFKDPITENITPAIIDTEQTYKTEVKVLTGSPGGTATVVESGWIKVAEILVRASTTSILDADIFNIDAEVTGGSNTGWTNDITSIYRNGTISDMKTIINSFESNISTNTSNISTNTGNISTNTGNISTNTGNISTNTGNISTLDGEVVKKTGAQSIAGIKTFISSPIVPTPTTDYQPAPKKYVDEAVSGSKITTSVSIPYTSKTNGSLDIIECSGLATDIIITVTDGGGDIRTQFKVINNDPTYSVFAKDSVTAAILWEVEPRKKELFYVDSGLKHGVGEGLVWKGSNQYITDAALLEGKPDNGDYFKGLLYYAGGAIYVTVDIRIGDNTTGYNLSPEYVGTTAASYDGPANFFGSWSANYPWVKLWKVYE